MTIKTNTKYCKYCKMAFEPKIRRQIYCKRQECFRKRRYEYMKKYMVEWKKKHPTYWKTPEQREYLRRWRQAHPDYFKKYRELHKKK